MFIEYEGRKIKETVKGEVKSICPITKEVDYHQFQVIYIPRNKLIEVLKLKNELLKLKYSELTSEELYNLLYNWFENSNPINLDVKVWDNSLGLNIEVGGC